MYSNFLTEDDRQDFPSNPYLVLDNYLSLLASLPTCGVYGPLVFHHIFITPTDDDDDVDEKTSSPLKTIFRPLSHLRRSSEPPISRANVDHDIHLIVLSMSLQSLIKCLIVLVMNNGQMHEAVCPDVFDQAHKYTAPDHTALTITNMSNSIEDLATSLGEALRPLIQTFTNIFLDTKEPPNTTTTSFAHIPHNHSATCPSRSQRWFDQSPHLSTQLGFATRHLEPPPQILEEIPPPRNGKELSRWKRLTGRFRRIKRTSSLHRRESGHDSRSSCIIFDRRKRPTSSKPEFIRSISNLVRGGDESHIDILEQLGKLASIIETAREQGSLCQILEIDLMHDEDDLAQYQQMVIHVAQQTVAKPSEGETIAHLKEAFTRALCFWICNYIGRDAILILAKTSLFAELRARPRLQRNPNVELIIPGRPLRRGDHIYREIRVTGVKSLMTHHGIYVGSGQVIHFSGNENALKTLIFPDQQATKLKKTCLTTFMKYGAVLFVQEYDGEEELFFTGNLSYRPQTIKLKPHKVFSNEDAAKRAELAYIFFHWMRGDAISEFRKNPALAREMQKIARKFAFPSYNLFSNNCEHFAQWCKTGVPLSQQVDFFSVAIDGLLKGLTN